MPPSEPGDDPGDAAGPARSIEEQRRELADSLHDGPQQVLTAIRLVADGTRHALDEGDADAARLGLERLEQLAAEGADQLRRLCALLDPDRREPAGPPRPGGPDG